MVGYQSDGSQYRSKNQQKHKQNDAVVIRGLSCISAFVNGEAKPQFLKEKAMESLGPKKNDFPDGSLVLDSAKTRVSESEAPLEEVPEGLRFDCARVSPATSESSSIGAPGEGSCTSIDESDGEAEVQSKFKGALGSMDSLEESLPIKRGLSNYFSGKSKSFSTFTSLSEATTAKDIAKPENSFNKRRRTLLACKNNTVLRRALYIAPKDLKLEEASEEEEEEEERSDVCLPPLPSHPQTRKLRNFTSPRSFSLTDLQGA
ncbi:uncharacterized protein LOC18435653 isoform X2 [Amborella trichopoda]|nr:uncharacterized protein LOC18435653 isoform X2 [Amborella trichopoda]|eukprot:XP_011623870.1 uncharacterized protein LOC18435653 isoform X2 [Amborella trichopoda]